MWWIPFAAGFEDGFGPCALMAVAVLILLYLWLKRDERLVKFLSLFIVLLLVLNFALNVGVFATTLALPAVQKFGAGFYKILAALVLVLGPVFFYDWTLLARGKEPGLLLTQRLFAKGVLAPTPTTALGLVVLTALLAGVAGTVWPPNAYISMIANNILVPGRRLESLVLLAVYTIVQLWVLLLVGYVILGRKLPLRLQELIYCAIFLTAGASVMVLL